jgi:hypothetical protein
MTDARADDVPKTIPFAITRRHFVLGACASAVAFAFGAAARVGAPAGASPALPLPLPTGGGLDAFLALSRQLTGRSGFDATLAKRVHDALLIADSQLTQNVAALNTWLQGHASVPSDEVIQALALDQPELAKTVEKVMRAWYLGLVGDIPNVRVIAYERALMFDPVKDVLTIPSYCKDVPFYWAHRPSLT